MVLCRDAEFRDVFFASCPWEYSAAWFCATTQSVGMFSLRRVLGQLEMGRITDMVPGGVRILAKEMACFSARMGGLVRNCPYFPEIRHPRKRIGVFFCEDVDWVTQTPTSWCDGVLFLLLEVFLADAAGWACPVGGEVFESGSGGYAFFRISFCGVVDVSADDAYIFIHNLISFGDAFQHPGRMSCDLWFWITKKAITLDCLQCKCFVWVVREMPCFTDKCR